MMIPSTSCTTRRTSSPSSIQSIIRSKLTPETNEPFFIVDLEALVEKYRQWKSCLPMVTPFYAVKCNPHPAILHTLARLGTGFDCASKAEIDKILEMGVDVSRILFANPCKMDSHIMYAREVNAKRMTFDNADELRKIARLFSDAELVLRIITDDSKSLCKFSVKFGAPMRDVPALLKLASELQLNVIGVSFHVGSGCASADSFALAARDALTVFKWGEEMGFNMRLLDLGGGWQGADDETPTLQQVAEVLVPVLDVFRQRFPDVEMVAEPGRYFATKSHTLVCNVFARRVVRDACGSPVRFIYYITDGVYQSFNCIFFDHQHPVPRVLLRDEISIDPAPPPSTQQQEQEQQQEQQEQPRTYSSMIFGPTCDSLDCISTDVELPELHVGDWLYFENMGAYTSCAQSAFNGFTGATTCHYVWGPKFVDSFYDVLVEPEMVETDQVEPDHPNHVEEQANELVSCIVGC